MSKDSDPGDVPIQLTERQFTLPEAAVLSRVPQRSIRNWIARDVIQLGERHFLGRWMFSTLDVLKLAVMHNLCVEMTFSPPIAARVVEMVAQLAMDSTRRDASGALLDDADGRRPNQNVVINFGEDGAPSAFVADIKRAGIYYPPEGDSPEAKAMRRGHVVIPATAMLDDILERTVEVIRSNRKAEVLVHD